MCTFHEMSVLWTADMDPYVLLTVNSQEKKSTVVSGTLLDIKLPLLNYELHWCTWSKMYMYAAQGSNPEWNETFLFTISDDSADLHLKIMEKDNFSADDYVGEAMWVYPFFWSFLLNRKYWFAPCFCSELVKVVKMCNLFIYLIHTAFL